MLRDALALCNFLIIFLKIIACSSLQCRAWETSPNKAVRKQEGNWAFTLVLNMCIYFSCKASSYGFKAALSGSFWPYQHFILPVFPLSVLRWAVLSPGPGLGIGKRLRSGEEGAWWWQETAEQVLHGVPIGVATLARREEEKKQTNQPNRKTPLFGLLFFSLSYHNSQCFGLGCALQNKGIARPSSPNLLRR